MILITLIYDDKMSDVFMYIVLLHIILNIKSSYFIIVKALTHDNTGLNDPVLSLRNIRADDGQIISS